jgi:hypothetical protein
MTARPNTYIVNFIATDVNLWALARYLHDSREIIAYWNYIPLVYCVKSYMTAAQLRDKLQPFFFPRSFLIAEVNIWNIDGVLPKEAWSWFYMDHHEKHQLPAGFGPPGRSLFDLLPPPKK